MSLDVSPAQLYGEPSEGAPERLFLRAGPLRMVLEAGTLRYLTVGEHEILRGIYAAVRDENWGTVPGVLRDVEVDDQGDAFEVRFTSEHVTDTVHFVWRGHITGESTGRVRFSFDSEAKTTFERNRIGFCVLHPMSCAGAPCEVEHTDGRVTEARFPVAISPHQPFENVRAIRHEVKEGLWAEVQMEGDTFEMEDQRNWTDASFKTYCTPLANPFPVRVEKGTKIEQHITVKLRGPLPNATISDETLSFRVSQAASPLPSLGLGAGRSALQPEELKRVKALDLSHLRLDLDLQKDFVSLLEQKTGEARALGLNLELALHLSDDAEAELRALARALRDLTPPIARVLIFHKDEKSTDKRWLEQSRKSLPDVPLAGGTDAFFTELNRGRPPTNALDLVTYSLNPQVHAFDNASLIETLPAQAVTVESAGRFSGEKPVIVSPVTLKMRRNPNAAGDGVLSLEQRTDPRQASLFGAGWTLGSLKHLFQSDAASLTYFKTTGPLGVMTNGEMSPDFPASLNSVYPVYHAFADVGEFKGGEVTASSSSHPLLFEGLVLRKDGRQRLMLANFTADEQTVKLDGLNGHYKGRVLDETTLEEALLEPRRFRSTFPLTFEADGDLSVTLNPYALLTLDGAS